jgi:hypothetical protein
VLSGPVNGGVFYGYIEQSVLPILQPDDILFIDNLSAHKVAGLEELVRSCGAHLIYLPPYSPDFNPIEERPTEYMWKTPWSQSNSSDASGPSISRTDRRSISFLSTEQ